MLVLYPYKNALWALRLCNRGRLLSVRPAPTLFDHLYASLHRAFGHTRPASVPGLNVGLPPQTKQGCLQSATQSHYARTHNDSHTKPLHDATAQIAVNAQMRWHKWLTTCTGATPQSKDALVACQKFCTMQNQQSKQHSTPLFYQR